MIKVNKIFITNILVITTILFFGFLPKVFAESSSSTEIINAEILSNVWYSTTTINEKDSINIYAGFQNHSIKILSGIAGFFVDDIQISKMDFVSEPKSLIKLETKYMAVRGSHTAQVKMLKIVEIGGGTANKFSVENLLARESEKSNFSVKYVITKEEVIKKTEEITNNVVKSIDTQMEKFANYMEGLKEPVVDLPGSEISPVKTIQNSIGKVLGMSTENADNIKKVAEKSQTNKGFSFSNMVLDISAYIIRHWVWTLIVVIAAVLYISFR